MRQLKINQQITNRDSQTFTKYLHEVSLIPMLTTEEEIQLAKEIRLGNKKALTKLVSSNLRFVISVAKQYNNQGLTIQDLVNEGNIGLIKAAERFDETRGFKFISYAVWWVRQAIMQAIAENGRQIRIPLNKVGMINKIKSAKSELEQGLQREATTYELSNYIMNQEEKKGAKGDAEKFSEEKVRELLETASNIVSLDAPTNNEENPVSISELIPGETEFDVEKTLKSKDLKIELERMIVTLKPRERDVLILFYGLFGNKQMSLEEIGKTFELTRERVRQIKENAIRRIRNRAHKTKLREYR